MDRQACVCCWMNEAAVQQEMDVTVVMCTSCWPGVDAQTAVLINIETAAVTYKQLQEVVTALHCITKPHSSTDVLHSVLDSVSLICSSWQVLSAPPGLCTDVLWGLVLDFSWTTARDLKMVQCCVCFRSLLYWDINHHSDTRCWFCSLFSVTQTVSGISLLIQTCIEVLLVLGHWSVAGRWTDRLYGLYLEMFTPLWLFKSDKWQKCFITVELLSLFCQTSFFFWLWLLHSSIITFSFSHMCSVECFSYTTTELISWCEYHPSPDINFIYYYYININASRLYILHTDMYTCTHAHSVRNTAEPLLFFVFHVGSGLWDCFERNLIPL